MKQEGKRIFYLSSPSAGPMVRRLNPYRKDLPAWFRNEGFDVIQSGSLSPVEAKKELEKVCSSDIGIVAAAGGDGTVNLAVNSIAGTSCKLLVLPLGSGNGLARHLGIPLDPGRAANLIHDGKVISADTGIVNGHRFASLAGIGFDALVAWKFSKNRHRGFWNYLRIIISEYFRYQPRLYRMDIDGTIHDIKALFIVFANGGQFGYNTNFAPEASVTDGYLDVVIFRKIPWRDIPRFLIQLMEGQPGKSSYAEVIKAKHVTVLKRRGSTVNLDGEAIQLSRRLEVSVDPASLNIYIPKKRSKDA